MSSLFAWVFVTLLIAPSLLCPPAGAALSDDKAPNPTTASVRLLPVPLTRQARDYTCGAAALQSVFAYYGDELREDVLSRELGCDPVSGTRYQRIARAARARGYQVSIFKGMSVRQLEGLIDSGHPVICLIQAWPERKVDFASDWDDGHYVVAVGHDRNNFYFMDPSTLGNYAFIPRPEFLKRWHDTDGKERLIHFGMTVTKPEPQHDPAKIKRLL